MWISTDETVWISSEWMVTTYRNHVIAVVRTLPTAHNCSTSFLTLPCVLSSPLSIKFSVVFDCWLALKSSLPLGFVLTVLMNILQWLNNSTGCSVHDFDFLLPKFWKFGWKLRSILMEIQLMRRSSSSERMTLANTNTHFLVSGWSQESGQCMKYCKVEQL